ncbi:tyrosine-type recombinase/integrase [Microbacterium saperdae]|nr:tyrosine-type recombinase/integrase [Microbacterium saperdae]GGM58594.1 tyrosine recombinase XerD [Microbacterium saperdae]
MSDTDALDAFADYQRSAGQSPATIRKRRSLLMGLVKYDNPLVECDVFTLRRHLGRDDVMLATRSAERYAFIAFYRFLQEEGIRLDNPSTRLPSIRVPRGEPRPFSPEQFDTLLSSGAYRRTRHMICLGYYQGFRVSSIARVHGSDIDLVTNTITTIGKGRKHGRLPLHPAIREIAASMPTDDWWFPSPKDPSQPIKPGAVSDLIHDAIRRSGITDRKLTPHSLRHSFGSNLVDAGVDIRVVKELMMHESLSTTQIYTRVSESKKQEGIAALRSRDIPAHSGRPIAGRHVYAQGVRVASS